MVEDSEPDTLLVVRELQHGGFQPAFERVETATAMRSALENHPWDLIISDYSMPEFGGPAALAIARELALDTPFIMVSGVLGEELAVEIMKAGAHDYVMKNNLTRLAPAVSRELRAAEERRVRRQHEAAVMHLASIVESCDDSIVGMTLEGIVVSWNAGAERMYGHSASEMIGRSVSVLIPTYRPGDLPELYEMIKRGERVERFETIRIRKDRTPIDVLVTFSPIKDAEGRVVGASTIGRDITASKREEQERLRLIQELTEALTQVKTLNGLLPICSGCKKIRDDQGYWQQVETYIKQRSNADFTHSVCPDCAQKLFPELQAKN
jgi:PAS domain S-box-containing protein